MKLQKITPFLWFNDDAERAANFYTSFFRNATILNTARYSADGAKASGRPEGSVMTVDFEIEGQRFTALNGGPLFPFSNAISFVIHCDSQKEIDYYWDHLADGGQVEECGWLKDPFGVSWQVVPAKLGEWMAKDGGAYAGKVMHALLQMKKLDYGKLEAAAGE